MHTFTIPSAVFRAVASFRAKSDIRYYLKSVLLELTSMNNMYLVATNGHAVCVADLGKVRTTGVAPHSTSVEPGQYIEPFRFIMDAELSEAVEILESAKNAELEFEIPAPKSMSINATIKSLKKGSQTIICKGIEGPYPDWQRVVHSYKKPIESKHVYIHPDYVKLVDSAAKTLRGLGKDKNANVFIQPGETATSLTCAQLDKAGYVWAYVMPVNVDTDKFMDPPSYS